MLDYIQQKDFPMALFVLRRSRISAYTMTVGIVLALVGYTLLLMAIIGIFGETGGTRQMAVPARVIIVLCLGIAFAVSARPSRHPAVIFFLLFSLFYFLRIGLEWERPSGNLYQSPQEFLLYFLSFVFFPFIFIAWTRLPNWGLELVLRWVFLALMGFVVLTLVLYGDYVGNSWRLTTWVTGGVAHITPLALSYVSALGMALILAVFLFGENTIGRRLFLALLFVGLLIPFFLGASRGSVVALGFVSVFILIWQKGVKRRFRFLLILAFGLFVAGYAQIYLGDGIFTRMSTIARGIETGAPEAVRVVMWRDGWEQFLASPIFGNSLQLETFRYHPHNMFIEVMISTGIVGMLLFIGFLAPVFKGAVRIIREAPKNAWVVVVFLIGFVSSFFSGSISAASIMAVGAGLIVTTVTGMPGKSKGLSFMKNKL